MQPIVCPIDSKDDAIQKVSAVVVSDVGRESEGYVTHSALARLLSRPSGPPQKPTVFNSIDTFLWIILGLASLVYIGVPFLIYAYIKATQIKTEREPLYPAKLVSWEQASKKWDRAYYCRKHDIVFDPETGDSAPPQKMSDFLGYSELW